MMDWSHQSLDLNPIEQIWGELEIIWTDLSYIQEKSFDLSCRRRGITLVLKFLWKYIDTMPDRCAAVITANGGHTKY